MEGVFMNDHYDEIVSLVQDTLVKAGSTFRQDKKEAYQRAIEKETDPNAFTMITNASEIVGEGFQSEIS